MNNQLFGSVKHSLTCFHLKVEFEMPECVSRICSMVWIFSLVLSHFASTGEFGRNIANTTVTRMVKTAQIM